MVNQSLLAIVLLLIVRSSFSQTYWQQEVNFVIDAKLNDNNHSISCNETIEYINHSPNTLDSIYMHVWPNAYRNGETALGKQHYAWGRQELTFGNDTMRGSIDGLNFTSNGSPLKWKFTAEYSDICIIYLPKPLKTGEGISISTPFTVKLPDGTISRLGHIGESYQLTQWYPKPAVYDKNGWHPIPYLSQGEFYSEFGSYDVTITLPTNYLVAATGDLQTPEEEVYRAKRIEETKIKLPEYLNNRSNISAFPPSDTSYKTVRFTQANVHDFAWFADKRFFISKGEATLPYSSRKVTTWNMWVPENSYNWQYADENLKKAVYDCSMWVGDYPYNQISAVDGTYSDGGGMEYPTITLIGNVETKEEFELFIVHEVMHNWFFGILASDERKHGWIDEGITTFYEVRYMQKYYPTNKALSAPLSNPILSNLPHFGGMTQLEMNDLKYRFITALGIDEPISTYSPNFSKNNYSVIMYIKTSLIFFYLKNYLGEEVFDQCIKTYYTNWQFKHPQPEDIQETFEQVSGKKLNWFFDDLINTTDYLDYKIQHVKQSSDGTIVTVKNVGKLNAPIEVNVLKDGAIVETKWVEVGAKKTRLHFSTKNPDEVRINTSPEIPELYRENNSWHSNGLFKKIEPLKVEFLFGDKESTKTNLFWLPVVGANAQDHFMLGAAFHSIGLSPHRFQWLVAPMYSFGRKSLSGIAELSYNCLPKKAFSLSRFGLSIKSFKDSTTERSSDGAYLAFSPYWTAKIGRRKTSPITQTITLQGVARADNFGGLQATYVGGFATYTWTTEHTNYSVAASVRNDFIQTSSNFQLARISTDVTYRFRYLKNTMSRWIELRGFVGNNYLFRQLSPLIGKDLTLGNNYAYSMSLSGSDGKQDLFFEDYYFNRGLNDGTWVHQRDENMGGFKSTSYYGTSTQWMASTNLYIQLPIPKVSILGVFVDAGVFRKDTSTYAAVNTGIGLRIGKVAGLYFPVWMSNSLKESFGDAGYIQKIRLTLHINIVNKNIKFYNFI